jgi:hypothetical protein
MPATCLAYVIVLDLIILIIFGEVYGSLQTMQLLIMQVSPASCHFIPFRSNARWIQLRFNLYNGHVKLSVCKRPPKQR